jgi:hypothetical protein
MVEDVKRQYEAQPKGDEQAEGQANMGTKRRKLSGSSGTAAKRWRADWACKTKYSRTVAEGLGVVTGDGAGVDGGREV